MYNNVNPLFYKAIAIFFFISVGLPFLARLFQKLIRKWLYGYTRAEHKANPPLTYQEAKDKIIRNGGVDAWEYTKYYFRRTKT
jgi:hypothetical protein